MSFLFLLPSGANCGGEADQQDFLFLAVAGNEKALSLGHDAVELEPELQRLADDLAAVDAVAVRGPLERLGKRSAYRLEGGRVQINGGQAANSAIRTTGYSVDILSTIDSLTMQGTDCRTMATGSTGQSYAIRNLASADIIINGCNLKGYTAAFQSGGTGAGITGNLT